MHCNDNYQHEYRQQFILHIKQVIFVYKLVYLLFCYNFNFIDFILIQSLSKFNGIHPGAILKRELKKRGIKLIELATEVNEHKQFISTLLKERRGINANWSVKIAKVFKLAPSFYMQIQAVYEFKQILKKQNLANPTPNLSFIRKLLFWYTNFDKFNRIAKKSAVIKRVFERGNELENQEIIRFYGWETLSKYHNDFILTFKENIMKYKAETLKAE
jgi:addiction module HigA family antidote